MVECLVLVVAVAGGSGGSAVDRPVRSRHRWGQHRPEARRDGPPRLAPGERPGV